MKNGSAAADRDGHGLETVPRIDAAVVSPHDVHACKGAAALIHPQSSEVEYAEEHTRTCIHTHRRQSHGCQQHAAWGTVRVSVAPSTHDDSVPRRRLPRKRLANVPRARCGVIHVHLVPVEHAMASCASRHIAPALVLHVLRAAVRAVARAVAPSCTTRTSWDGVRSARGCCGDALPFRAARPPRK
jgi:hypothetical protein